MSEEQATWIYQARRVNTQTNAGGGALRTIITLASGQLARIVQCAVIGPASVTSTLIITVFDEDGMEYGRLFNCLAGASNVGRLPSIGSGGTATGNIANSTGLVLPAGATLAFDGSVAIQNETLTVGIVLELLNLPTVPTWATTGSAGTPSLAASTISAANTLTPGRLWT